MSKSLEKILNLAKKTGDNVIVYNPAKPEDSYVILALNSYEKLVDNTCWDDCLTEDEDDDKINPEIEDWAEENGWSDDLSEDQQIGGFNPDFLPEDIFGNSEEMPSLEAEDEAEDTWEEEVNYLYPTAEEFASLAKEEESSNDNDGDFNAISDILEERREKKNNWTIPDERQNLDNLDNNN